MDDHKMEERKWSVAGIAWTVFSWKANSILFCLFLSLTNMTIQLYLPLYNGRLLDAVVRPNQRYAVVFHQFLRVMAMMILSGLISILQSYLEKLAGAFLNIHTTNFALHRVLSQDMSFFQHDLTKPGKLMSRIQSDAHEFPFLVHNFLFSVVNTLYGLLLTFWILATEINIPWRLLVIGLASQPLILGLTIIVSRMMEKLQIEVRGISARIQEATMDIMQNITFIKLVLSMREVMGARQREQYILYDRNQHMIRLQSIIDFDIFCWTTLVNAGLLWIGIDSTLSGQMTWGDFTSFQSYIKGIQTRLNGCFSLVISWRKAIGVAQNFATMLRTPITLETHTRKFPYRTERPKFKERPETIGSAVSHAIRSFLQDRPKSVLFQDLLGHTSGLSNLSSSMQGSWRPLDEWWYDESKQRYRSLYTPPPMSVRIRGATFHYPVWKTGRDEPNKYELPRREDEKERQKLILELCHEGDCRSAKCTGWCDINIPAGSHVLIKGPNGCGKSTLLAILMRLWRLDKGEILLNDRNLESFPPEELRSQIGFLKQDSPIFMGSILSNIFAGRGGDLVSDEERKQQKAVTEAFLKSVKFPLNMPDLDEPMHNKDSKSGGQRQKIALLRLAMFETNSMLMLDEPTNHLDPACQTWLFQWLTALKKNRGNPNAYQPTVIIISHQADLARFTDLTVEFPVPRWMAEAEARLQGLRQVRKPQANPQAVIREPEQKQPNKTAPSMELGTLSKPREEAKKE